MNLVVLSLEPWDDVWRRNQHLVHCLLDLDPALRVLFVEPAADPLHDLIAGRRPSRGSSLVEVAGTHGRLVRYRPIKLLPRKMNPRADEHIARSIIRAAARAGMADPVLWVNDPGAAPVARLSGWPTLYDITDDWLLADRPAAELDRVRVSEEWLLAHAHAVVACSPALVQSKSAGRPGAIDLIPNAVDVAAYRSPRRRPGDLPAVAAVYVGTLHTDRLDVELCATTAAALADHAALVLIGPNALATADTVRLRGAGVVLLGPRAHDDVIAYLQHADVLVVPHVVTPFTDSLDPIKLYEYAAVGRPVVSTPVAGFRDTHDERVSVVPNSTFPRAVAAALPARSRFPDGAEDAVAGWVQRAVDMRAVIDQVRRGRG